MTNKKNDSHANESQESFGAFNLPFNQTEFAKQLILHWCRELEGKTEDEAIANIIEKIAINSAENQTFKLQIKAFSEKITQLEKGHNDLCKANDARKAESVAIGQEQQKIHKWYRDQFKKIQGWRWWQ